MLVRLLSLSLILSFACGDDDTDTTGGDDASVDAGPIDMGPPDAFEVVQTVEELPDPEAFQAGVAEIAIPAPVGIGTMGFSPFGAPDSITPFADMHPGTTRMHGQLDFKAVAFSRGPAHEVVLVRMDTIGVFEQLRAGVLDELEERLGRRLDESLVLAGNHTHSGPGRLLMTEGVLTALGDNFLPEFYDRVVTALADVIEAALDDLAPAELGFVMAETSAGHNDRRCENDSLDIIQENPELPMIAVRREGEIDALVLTYAYHGTILGIDELTLSGDMGSVVEQRIAERLDHPVSVLLFNSWGADMSPSNPEPGAGESGGEQPASYDRMDRIGSVIADAIVPQIDSLTYESEPTIRARTYRTHLNRDAINYDEDTFSRYRNGGAFCGAGSEGNCEDSEPVPDLDRACIPVPPNTLPQQTLFTTGQIGEVYFVTAPGEWSTALGTGLMERMRDAAGAEHSMMIGYANDYTGYSITEEDWWQGGYEASGGLWGPKQGDFLADMAFGAFESYLMSYIEPPYREPAPLEPFSGYTYDPYVPETAVGVGDFAVDVPASVSTTDTLEFTVQGTDPWIGTPVAVLERDSGGGSFEAVVRSNGLVVDSTSYDFWADLAVSPTYADELRADARTFEWTFHFPVSRRAGVGEVLSGDYRFAVTLPTDLDGGTMVVHSATFTVP
ncbi:MAG: neutral/alkaline non-lysosomal ceramidase N-terminal domain-containing protein [Deltaproteobacteria bacterium]|nr:neutral/alkaline non-lysosomal ceramidase N-terminal domain-containing protein [Deltaproteobacteria bacterium]